MNFARVRIDIARLRWYAAPLYGQLNRSLHAWHTLRASNRRRDRIYV